jgi:sterol desaturase/sphingolipid hydroxylase (fatty acid hydroxylase superfamily)
MVGGWEHAVTGIGSLFHGMIDSYHRLNPKLRGALSPMIVLLKYLLPIFILERLSGGSTTQYKSAEFRQDLVYWIIRTSGAYRALLTTFVLLVLAPNLKIFDLHLLDRFVPHPHNFARLVVYYVIADFTAYWVHRLQHRSRFLWAFHTTHHSQRNMSFITLNRMHPFEEIFHTILTYTPTVLLGATAQDLVPIVWLLSIVAFLQHSQVRWKFGILEKILVTPHFHAIHHSADPAHRDRNFGVSLSIWDYCFGTSVEDTAWPASYGLDDIEMPTIVSTFLLPFRMVYESYFKRRDRVGSAGD